MTDWHLILIGLFVLAVIAGATAAVTGFGIGSILTPAVATFAGMTAAVAAVAIPHVAATGLRCWRLRRSIDWAVLRSFGLLSAAGGVAGAAIHSRVSNEGLTRVLGTLLIATAIAGLSGWTNRVTPGRVLSGVFGAASGLFGGVAGNQGGLRAAALMTYRLRPAAFVATATATGLLVDAARVPFYLALFSGEMLSAKVPIVVMTAGVVTGTLIGERALFGLRAETLRRVVSVLIALLGAWLLIG